MFSAIGFAIQIFLSGLLVIPLSFTKTNLISRDKVSIYALASIVACTLIIISREIGQELLSGSLFIAIGIISYSQLQKEKNWVNALQSVIPLWIVTVIGMCVGAWMFLQAVILTVISYYVINFLPTLLNQNQNTEE